MWAPWFVAHEGQVHLFPLQRLAGRSKRTAADGLEHVLDHQTGTIESLDLRDLSIPATTKAVHQGTEGKIIQTQQPHSKGTR